LVLAPALIDDTAVLSKFVDTVEYGFIEWHVHVGVVDTTLAVKVQEDDEADGSDGPTDVDGAAIVTITGATQDLAMVIISVAKSALTKRYVGLSLDPGDGSAGCFVSAEAFRWGKSGSLAEVQETGDDDPYITSQVIRVS